MVNSDNFLQAKSYHDLQGLQSLKKATSQNGSEAEALKEASKHFEAFFLQMILKSARQANTHINEDEGLFNSQNVQFYQEMLDEQMSVEISLKANNGSGLGVADMLTKQLTKKTNGALDDKNQSSTQESQKLNTQISMPRRAVNFADVDVPEEFKVVGLRQTIKYREDAKPNFTFAHSDKTQVKQKSVADSIKEDLVSAVNFSSEKLGEFTSPTDFVKKLYPIAKKVGSSFGFDPKILLAQSALETGWGKYVMSAKDGGSSHNLFGIKADSRWNGNSTKAATIEFRGGVARQEIADFRSYLSFEESMKDYVNFLTNNPRYKQALQHKQNPEIFAGHLQKAGYATDPKYSAKIVNIMNMEYLQNLETMKF